MKTTVLTISTVLLALSLPGCASIEPVPISGPNGKAAYTMKCSGFGRTLDACYAKAGEVCPSGYLIVDRETTPIAVATGGNLVVGARRSLVVECK